MINSYYLIEDGVETGPFTHQELMEKGLSADTLVLSPLFEHWQSAGQLPEFSQYFFETGVIMPQQDNLASFWWRLLAYIIDYIIIVLILSIGAGLFELVMIFTHSRGIEDTADFVFNLLVFIVMTLYNALFEASKIQGSLGKKICGLIVVESNGERIAFSKALLRNLGKILSSLICGIGFLTVLWDNNRQAWHDQLAKTYVIRPGK